MGAIELGRLVKGARSARELSFREAAAAAGLAVSHLQRLERGEVAEPSPRVLARLAVALEEPSLERRRLYTQFMVAAGYLPGPGG